MVDALMKNGPCIYFFFDFRDERKQTLRELLLSLICQLYSASNGPREVLHQLYSSRDWNGTKPSTESLIRAFDNMLQQSGQVQLLLDALDESKKGRDREELLQWLRKHIGRTGTKNSKLRIIMTSRSGQQDIIDTLSTPIPGKAQLSVEGNAFSVREDIRRYIERRIMKDRMFSRWRNQARGQEECISEEESLSEDELPSESDSLSSYESLSENELVSEDSFLSEEEFVSENELKPENSRSCKELDFDTVADESKWDPILRKARDVLVEKVGTM